MHQYSRAERLLTRPLNDEEGSPLVDGDSGPFATLKPSEEQRIRGLSMGGPSLPFSRMAQPLPEPLNFDVAPPPFRLPGDMDEPTAPRKDERSCTLVDLSVACRYLAAQCQVRQGKWAEATEMLGEANPFRGPDGSRTTNIDISIQVRFLCINEFEPVLKMLCEDRGIYVLPSWHAQAQARQISTGERVIHGSSSN